ncbi:hypothetical protein MRB53_039053 [Persea americana]|nr:hypothetical protein MRB53_039053 [Persea americana]
MTSTVHTDLILSCVAAVICAALLVVALAAVVAKGAAYLYTLVLGLALSVAGYVAMAINDSTDASPTTVSVAHGSSLVLRLCLNLGPALLSVSIFQTFGRLLVFATPSEGFVQSRRPLGSELASLFVLFSGLSVLPYIVSFAYNCAALTPRQRASFDDARYVATLLDHGALANRIGMDMQAIMIGLFAITAPICLLLGSPQGDAATFVRYFKASIALLIANMFNMIGALGTVIIVYRYYHGHFVSERVEWLCTLSPFIVSFMVMCVASPAFFLPQTLTTFRVRSINPEEDLLSQERKLSHEWSIADKHRAASHDDDVMSAVEIVTIPTPSALLTSPNLAIARGVPGIRENRSYPRSRSGPTKTAEDLVAFVQPAKPKQTKSRGGRLQHEEHSSAH